LEVVQRTQEESETIMAGELETVVQVEAVARDREV